MSEWRDRIAQIMIQNIAENNERRDEIDEFDFQKSRMAEPLSLPDVPKDEAEEMAEDEKETIDASIPQSKLMQKNLIRYKSLDVQQLRPLLNRMDKDNYHKLKAAMEDAYRTMKLSDFLEWMGQLLGRPMKGSGASVLQRGLGFIDRLMVTWYQTGMDRV